ncbi:hypothetical protein [Bosea sp. (in: a-proteobacteria)]|jgi:hypothetical protein|uniref:hypothetical protein n=1 Tax=Bosea sp. (in: a-proteobacteria) TaxID=1871050 RepID=UPI002DDDA74F|nr:hypothetical protein [Bosea sp. (in: a-proteobacteria)]HEV2512623.1 hypothetical protein [Bosea sp. (in: a-proteobacteria)]
MTSPYDGNTDLADQRCISSGSAADDLDASLDRGAAVVLAGMSAISGALVGFILAGALETAIATFAAALAAGYLGWRARELL